MGENNDSAESAEEQLLIERIEVASEIVRSSQAAVAFQRAFYLEVLTFDRVENEIDEFTGKVNKLQGKLSILFNDLQHAENDSGAGRASAISEKLETLKNSFDDFKKRAHEARRQREARSQELNDLIVPALKSASTRALHGWSGVQAVNLMPFVNDAEFHLAEETAEEWGKLRRKLENYLHHYIEETTALRVEVFGATYVDDNPSPHPDDSSRGMIRKISSLMSRKTGSFGGSSGHGNRRSTSRSESFFYCNRPQGGESQGEQQDEEYERKEVERMQVKS